jgi:hypothetical protein
MTYASAAIEQLRLRRPWLGFKRHPPVAERLERNALSFAILPLVQVATLPRLVVRSPEGFALTRPRSVLVHHLALLICKSRTEQIVLTNGSKSVREMDAYYAYAVRSLIPLENSLFLKLFSLISRVGNFTKGRSSTAVSCNEIGS